MRAQALVGRGRGGDRQRLACADAGRPGRGRSGRRSGNAPAPVRSTAVAGDRGSGCLFSGQRAIGPGRWRATGGPSRQRAGIAAAPATGTASLVSSRVSVSGGHRRADQCVTSPLWLGSVSQSRARRAGPLDRLGHRDREPREDRRDGRRPAGSSAGPRRLTSRPSAARNPTDWARNGGAKCGGYPVAAAQFALFRTAN